MNMRKIPTLIILSLCLLTGSSCVIIDTGADGTHPQEEPAAAKPADNKEAAKTSDN